MIRIHPSWREALASEFSAPYFSALTEFVRAEYAAGTCYPPAGEIFAAFDRCPFSEVKVVLLGQDPYHGAGQAEGLCFRCAMACLRLLRCKTSLRNCTMILAFPYRHLAVCGVGPTKVCFCSMQRLRFGPALPVRTKGVGGKPSPMRQFVRSPLKENTSYSSFGGRTPDVRRHLSIVRVIASLLHRIPLRFLPTVASSVRILSHGRTPIS